MHNERACVCKLCIGDPNNLNLHEFKLLLLFTLGEINKNYGDLQIEIFSCD